MKILITGASGYIGTVLRPIFADDEVTLLSRRPIAAAKNEKWFVSGNVQDAGWWDSLPRDDCFDVIFHLAEPVKASVDGRVRQSIIEGHLAFISHFARAGAKLIYPLTAYLYDSRLSRSNANYAQIKREVYRRLKDDPNVSFPIIHPVRDSGRGLGRLIQIEKRIPLVNLMCAFESTIPVLGLADLKRVFTDPTSIAPGRFDVFSEIMPIRQLFNDDARANVRFLSRALRQVLTLVSFVPGFDLLVKGRSIDVSIL